MAQLDDTQGGLNDPDVNAASQSADIRNTLQNEINRQNSYTRSRAFAVKNSLGILAPYSNLAQSIAISDANKNNQYKQLFNMRQELGQANLLNSLRGQNTAGFGNFDPATAQNLQAQYNMNPGQATKSAADLSGTFAKQAQQEQLTEQGDANRANLQNQQLTQSQKELAAAGIQPGTPEYNAKILGDQDLNTFAQKMAIADPYKQADAERNAQLELLKQANLTQLQADLYKQKEGSQLSKSLAQDSAAQIIKDAQGADKALPAIRQNIEILKNPNFGGGLGMDALTSLATAPVFSTALKNLSPDQAQAVEDYRQYKSNIEQQIIPIAHSLGTNPSNQDAIRLEQSVGGLSTPRKVMVSNTAKLGALAEMKQAQRDEVLAAEGDPKRIAEITKKYADDKLFNQYYEKYLNEIVSQAGGTIGNSESSNTNRKPLSAFGS